MSTIFYSILTNFIGVEPKIKKNKYILRFIIAFALGFFLSDIFSIFGIIVGDKSAEDAFKYFKPVVYAETHISKAIEESLPIKIPDDATNIYYAWDGFLDIHEYIALTLSTQKKCEEFLEKQLKMPPDKFKEDKLSIEDIKNSTPSGRPEKYRGNWDLKDYENVPFCYYQNPAEEDTGASVYYFPEQGRIFIEIYNVFAFEHLHLKRGKP